MVLAKRSAFKNVFEGKTAVLGPQSIEDLMCLVLVTLVKMLRRSSHNLLATGAIYSFVSMLSSKDRKKKK